MSITFKGTPIHTKAPLPAVGSTAPDFALTKSDLSEMHLHDFAGKNVILNIFLSLDTGTCAQSVRTFNEEAAGLKNTQVLCISSDLPFAQARFCGAEGITNVITASDFRHKEFGERYGVRLVDGPVAGLLARAVVVINPTGKIVYTELVAEQTHEPNYQSALKALQ